MEIIIATAVLAGSAMVLISLIGAGTRYGSKAELRSFALSAAQTVLDEFLIEQEQLEDRGEVTGTVEGHIMMSYRLAFTSYTPSGSSANASGIPGLVRITVEIFEAPQIETQEPGPALCSLTRLVRRRSGMNRNSDSDQQMALRPGQSDD